MYHINYAFREDKKQIRQLIPGDKASIKEYDSTAEYYEAKIEFELRQKLPTYSKFTSGIFKLFSELIILFFLIIQGLILILESPSVFFWGILIF